MSPQHHCVVTSSGSRRKTYAEQGAVPSRWLKSLSPEQVWSTSSTSRHDMLKKRHHCDVKIQTQNQGWSSVGRGSLHTVRSPKLDSCPLGINLGRVAHTFNPRRQEEEWGKWAPQGHLLSYTASMERARNSWDPASIKQVCNQNWITRNIKQVQSHAILKESPVPFKMSRP